MDGADHRMAVVLVQTGQAQRLGIRCQRRRHGLLALDLSGQRASDHRIEAPALGRQVLTQALALLLAQRAQLVVVVAAERGLAVAHEVEGSHAARLCRRRDGRLVAAATVAGARGLPRTAPSYTRAP